jgi:hypothetical protein
MDAWKDAIDIAARNPATRPYADSVLSQSAIVANYLADIGFAPGRKKSLPTDISYTQTCHWWLPVAKARAKEESCQFRQGFCQVRQHSKRYAEGNGKKGCKYKPGLLVKRSRRYLI